MTIILTVSETTVHRLQALTCVLLGRNSPEEIPDFVSCRNELLRAAITRGLDSIEAHYRAQAGQEKSGDDSQGETKKAGGVGYIPLT